MVTLRLLGASVVVFAGLGTACGAAPDGATAADGDAQDEQAITSAAPSPFTLQFAGTYDGSTTTGLKSLELRLDGTYALKRADGTQEKGRFTGGATKTTPLVITLSRGANHWTAQVAGYDGKLVVGGQTLKLKRPTLSDEDLCDGTSGAWTDDEQDPATGLFCVCKPARLFVPSAGGCVTRNGKH